MDLEFKQSPTQFIGPMMPDFRLAVQGYRVPHVSVSPIAGDDTVMNISLGGFGICADVAEIERWAPLVAHAMAYAAGFTCHGEGSQPRNDYRVGVLCIERAEGD